MMITTYLAAIELGAKVLQLAVDCGVKLRETLREKVWVKTSDEAYLPGEGEVLPRFLAGEFPAIQGTYRVEVEGHDYVLDLVPHVQDDGRIFWYALERFKSNWWLIDPSNPMYHWHELLEPGT